MFDPTCRECGNCTTGCLEHNPSVQTITYTTVIQARYFDEYGREIPHGMLPPNWWGADETAAAQS